MKTLAKNLIIVIVFLLVLRAVIVEAITIVDPDEDGVINDEDFCPNTETDNFENLGKNRWLWSKGYGWLTTPPYGKGNEESFTMLETHGCSCSQILNWLNTNNPEEYSDDANMEGQWKFGCSVGIMREFILHTE